MGKKYVKKRGFEKLVMGRARGLRGSWKTGLSSTPPEDRPAPEQLGVPGPEAASTPPQGPTVAPTRVDGSKHEAVTRPSSKEPPPRVSAVIAGAAAARARSSCHAIDLVEVSSF